ncbi:MAG: chemotaxis protein CheW [Planctomycetota bacterium]
MSHRPNDEQPAGDPGQLRDDASSAFAANDDSMVNDNVMSGEFGENEELRAAIAAAFGAEALDSEGDFADLEAPEVASDADQESLQSLIARLDQKMESLGGSSTPQVSQPATVPTTVEQRFVVFETAGRTAAFPLAGIEEIERLPSYTSLPRTPDWLRGITNLRGQIVSVTDLAALVGENTTVDPSLQKVIVVHSAKLDATTAVAVDRVIGIRNFAGNVRRRPEDLTEPLAMLADQVASTETNTESNTGLVLLIDPDRLLEHPEMTPFMQA